MHLVVGKLLSGIISLSIRHIHLSMYTTYTFLWDKTSWGIQLPGGWWCIFPGKIIVTIPISRTFITALNDGVHCIQMFAWLLRKPLESDTISVPHLYLVHCYCVVSMLLWIVVHIVQHLCKPSSFIWCSVIVYPLLTILLLIRVVCIACYNPVRENSSKFRQ